MKYFMPLIIVRKIFYNIIVLRVKKYDLFVTEIMLSFNVLFK